MDTRYPVRGTDAMSADDSTAPTGRTQESDLGPDRLAEVKQHLDGTMDVMEDNMRKMAMRGEQMDTLLDKSHILGETSDEFRGRSRQLEQSMWWKKWQMFIIVGGLCFATLLCLFMVNRIAFWIGVFIVLLLAGIGIFYVVKTQRSLTDPAVLYYGNGDRPSEAGLSMAALGSSRVLNRWEDV